MIAGEFQLIESLTRGLSKVGDDCAVLPGRPGFSSLISTDTMVEGIHFLRHWTDPVALGHKLLHINASDIAAMGGRPLSCVISLVLPKTLTQKWVKDLYKGLRQAARTLKIELVGGNTARSPRDIVLTLTILGEISPKFCVWRSGAKRGDDLYVTGTLGDAACGLKLLKTKKRGEAYLKQRFSAPCARVLWGQRLAKTGLIHAMLDVSDGLLSDLCHIMQASGVGAILHLSQLPLSASLRRACKKYQWDPTRLALSGGEDYELLFTAPARKRMWFTQWARRQGIPLTYIGQMTSNRSLKVLDSSGRRVTIKRLGYDHFKR